jgi:putative methyltransferase (TIGR04325 family)
MKASRLLSFLFDSNRSQSLPTYDTYQDARAEHPYGYEDPAIVGVVSEKTARLQARLREGAVHRWGRQTIQNAFVVARTFTDSPIAVLDVGGACGATFIELESLMAGKIATWNVVETAAMVAEGRRRFSSQRLTFSTSPAAVLESLPRRDLLIASGVLQYLSDPITALTSWLGLGFRFLYLTRTMVRSSGDNVIYSRQEAALSSHGPGPLPPGLKDGVTSTPMSLVSLSRLLAAFPREYAVLCQFDEGDSRPVRLGDRKEALCDVGFLLERSGSQG